MHSEPWERQREYSIQRKSSAMYREEHTGKTWGVGKRTEKRGSMRLKSRAGVSQSYKSSAINALLPYLGTTSGMPPVAMATWLEA